jgi:hypothetical protein
MTTTEIESFYDDGSKAGALVRKVADGSMQTTLVFEAAAGPVVHLFQETRFEAVAEDWSAYRYVDHLEGSVADVRSESLLQRPDHPQNPVPSYAAHLVLKDFLATGASRREFSQFNETDPSVVSAAAFVRLGPEQVETPWGSTEAVRVVLEIDGREGNIFWCAHGSVVKSDWQGATSYATDDVEFLMQGLAPEVQAILKATLG